MNIFITSATAQRRIIVDRLDKEGIKSEIFVWTRSDSEGRVLNNLSTILTARKYDMFIVWQEETRLYNYLQSNGYPVRLLSDLVVGNSINAFVSSLLQELNALRVYNNPLQLMGFEPAKVKPSESYSSNNPLHYAGITAEKIRNAETARVNNSINVQLKASRTYYIYDTTAIAVFKFVSSPTNIGNVLIGNPHYRIFDSKVKLADYLDNLFAAEIKQIEQQLQELESKQLKIDGLRISALQSVQNL